MFGFPENTAMKQVIAKDSLLGRIGSMSAMTTAQKAVFNRDVKQVTITNMVSPKTMPMASGSRAPGFFVANVALKQKAFNPKNVEMLLHRIGQKNILLVLCVENVARFALKYDDHVVVSKEWVVANDFSFVFDGLDLDAVWNGIVKQVAGEPWNDSLAVAENLVIQEHIAQLKKEIEVLEKKARTENQPARKLELFNKKRDLESQLTEYQNGKSKHAQP